MYAIEARLVVSERSRLTAWRIQAHPIPHRMLELQSVCCQSAVDDVSEF